MKETGLPVVMNPQNLGYSTMSVPTESEQKETELPVVMKPPTLVIALHGFAHFIVLQHPVGHAHPQVGISALTIG